MSLGLWGTYVASVIITAGVGWLTNWVGIMMMFYPVNYVGYGKFLGWQGIIPRLRVRLTRTLVAYSVSKICTPQEVFNALDESDVVEDLTRLLNPQINDWVDEIIDEHGIALWQMAPQAVRNMVYERVREQAPEISRAILRELKSVANSLLNIEDIAVEQVKDRPEFLVDLFMKCAGKELNFVIHSGIYFGAPLGVVQVVAWDLIGQWWILPLFGILAGALTNWIAVLLIAHPADPIKLGRFTLQGLYLKRQQEVSQLFGETFCRNFLNSHVLITSLWEGEHADQVRRMVRRHVRNALNQSAISSFLTRNALKNGGVQRATNDSVEMAIASVTQTLRNPEINAQVTQPIAELLSGRMRALSPREFQKLLLPAFKEDEALVVLVGGVLGGIIGFLQLVFLFEGL